MYPMGTIIKKTNHHHNYHHRHQQQVDRILQLINEIADRSAAWRRTRTKTTAFEDKRDGSKQPVKGSRRNSCHKNINTLICHGYTFPAIKIAQAGRKRTALDLLNAH